MVRCEESDDDDLVLGFISVLNFDRYKDLKCLKQLISHILKQCEDPVKKHVFEQVLLWSVCSKMGIFSHTQVMHSSKAGLIINERLLNVPPRIGPPLNQSLFEEIRWAQEDEPTEVHQWLHTIHDVTEQPPSYACTQELKISFKMDAYVVMTHVYQDTLDDQKSEHPSKKSKVLSDTAHSVSNARVFGQVVGPTGYIYVKPEDEFYHKFSKEWFVIPCPDLESTTEGLKSYRLVLLIPHESVTQAQ